MKTQLHKDLKGRAFTLQTNLESLADPKQALNNLVQKYGQDKIAYAAYIIHDKDIDENGQPVKPHMHGIFKFRRLRLILSANILPLTGQSRNLTD